MNYGKTISVESIETRIQELEEESWIVGKNMPGYLPDNPPEAVDSFETARVVLTGWLEEELEMAQELLEGNYDRELSDEHRTNLEHLVLSLQENLSHLALCNKQELGFVVGGWHYFAMPNDDIKDELSELRDIEQQCQKTSGWQNEMELIHEDHFYNYVRETAEEGYGKVDFQNFPFCFIDWYEAVEFAKADYKEIEIDNRTYYILA